MELIKSYNVFARKRFQVIITLYYSPKSRQYLSRTEFEPVETGATMYVGGFTNQVCRVLQSRDIVHSQVFHYIEKYELINVIVAHFICQDVEIGNILSLSPPLTKIISSYLGVLPIFDIQTNGTTQFCLNEIVNEIDA